MPVFEVRLTAAPEAAAAGLYRTLAALLVVAAIASVAIGIKMAQPWGDNYAYQHLGGYLVLAGFLLFAVSPCVGLWLLARIFRGHATASKVFVIGALLIAAAAVYAYFDVAFMHPDAQGGLVFLFLPVYQWFAAAVLTVLCSVIRARAGARGEQAR